MKIGVLALQGDYEAHQHVLEACGAQVVAVRDAAALENLNGLVIPGGESTVMSRLCDRYELWQPLRDKIEGGMGVFGTCAGLIFMAHEISGATRNFAQKTLNVLDIKVERNAYGAQLDSFEADIAVPSLNRTVRGVFIRAPRVAQTGPAIEVLAQHEGAPVVVRQGKHVATSFHPEIAGETALHELWLEYLRLK
jgi:pyridoxal 5'-phosphate synthase pdxT subunit